MTGGGGKRASLKAVHFPSNESCNSAEVGDLICGVLSVLAFLVYAIALKTETGSSFSRKAFQCFLLAVLIAKK